MFRSGLIRRQTIRLLLSLIAVTFVVSACIATPSGPGTPSPGAASPSPQPSPSSPRGVPNFGHIFVIVMENKEYSQILGSDDAPYLNQLASTYAVASRYYGVRHPSLPNYLALISGSTQGITDDCPTCTLDATNLADQIESRGKAWRAYMEDLPSPCFNGPTANMNLLGRGGYARKHNPWLYFDDIRGNPTRCQRVVPLSQWQSDIQKGQLPDFVWFTPNLQHDMHDGTVAEGDAWLAGFVPSILASPAWQQNGVLFIVWDEGTSNAGPNGKAAGGRTLALVVAAQGKRGYKSDAVYNQYSLLRTIEEAWQLGYLGHAGDADVASLAEFFE
jgi:phosphatidylinositol-3-phosphatase